MGIPTTQRVLAYTALFAGGTVLASPVLGMSAGIAAGADAVASLMGNTLASDIHAAFASSASPSLTNHHLQMLVGNALAVLIECHEKEKANVHFATRLAHYFRVRDVELCELAKAAKKHWSDAGCVAADLNNDNDVLSDSNIHTAFTDRDRTSTEPLVSAREWDRHLHFIAEHAENWYGSKIFLSETRRQEIAEYIAPRFAVAVRELVKADLDPSVGTGGRVFIALHLDLMRALSVSIRGVDAKNDEILGRVDAIQKHLEKLTELVVTSLSPVQKGEVFDLVIVVREEHHVTRALMERGFAELKQQANDHEAASKRRHNDVMERHDDEAARLERIEKLLLANQQANPNTPAPLSPEDQAFLAYAKAHGNLKTRAAASVLQPDEDTDGLLAELQARHDADAFELAMLKGKRYYFATPIPQYDAAIPHFERAVAINDRDFDARNYLALSHNSARLGDIAAHQQAAIELYEGTLNLTAAASTAWAMTQNNLGNAWLFMPTGDRGANLARAIAAYESALTVRTREAHPVAWATTQNNLGLARQNMPTGDRGANLAQAIAAYESALMVYTRKAHPIDWAMTQNNLGTAWQVMPTGDRGANLARAIGAYEFALTVCTREEHPIDWARTQNNLGTAWQDMPTGDRGANLAQAIAAYESALTVRTREAHPVAWASTLNNLGAAWKNMPTGDRGVNRARAIAAYESALTVHTRKTHPFAWATIQYNLAIAYADLANLSGENRCACLQQAIACGKGALIVRTAEAFPHDHVQTLENLQIDRQAYEEAGCAEAMPFDEIPPAQ